LLLAHVDQAALFSLAILKPSASGNRNITQQTRPCLVVLEQ